MWRAFQNQGGADNLPLLAQLASLRREYAGLFGFNSYADFALRRRMAQSEAQVQGFLRSVRDVVGRRELKDLAVLRAGKAKNTKQPLQSSVWRSMPLTGTTTRRAVVVALTLQTRLIIVRQ